MSTNEAAASQEDIALAQGAVLVKSCQVPDGSIPIRGFDFSTASGPDFSLSAILSSYMSTGFQATHLAQAIQVASCKKFRFNLEIRRKIENFEKKI